jgi:hypothetical protein
MKGELKEIAPRIFVWRSFGLPSFIEKRGKDQVVMRGITCHIFEPRCISKRMLGCSDPEPSLATMLVGNAPNSLGAKPKPMHDWMCGMLVAFPGAGGADHPCLSPATSGYLDDKLLLLSLHACSCQFGVIWYQVIKSLRCQTTIYNQLSSCLLVSLAKNPWFMVPETPCLHLLVHFANLLQCHVPRSGHVRNPVSWSGLLVISFSATAPACDQLSLGLRVHHRLPAQ